MTDNFESRLDAALKTGREQSKRSGNTIKATVLRLMDAGESDGVNLLIRALAVQGDLPAWLNSAPLHEVASVLSTWGSVRHAMACWKRAKKKEQNNGE